MAEFDNRGYAQAQSTAARTGAAAIDEGLRAYMLKVYNYMALGVAFTAIVTMAVASNPQLMATIAMGQMKWVLFIGILGMGFMAPRLIFSGNTAVAQLCYWAYARLVGRAHVADDLLLLPDGRRRRGLIVRALLITSVTFGATSLFGYVTKKNLSGLGTFFMMATIGLLVAIVVNAIFFQDVGFSLVISCLVVLVFAGITAYETQMIKEMYVSTDGQAVVLPEGHLRRLHALWQLRHHVHPHLEHPGHHERRLTLKARTLKTPNPRKSASGGFALGAVTFAAAAATGTGVFHPEHGLRFRTQFRRF